MTKFAPAFFLVLLLAVATPGRAAGPRITEFLAENDGGLRDENGDSPDWIELLNDSLVTADLAGWHLTDNPTNLTKWTFPSTNLPSGSFLVVFASGKDRAVAGAPLHTGFQLDNGGGYLALVQPDGVTIASEFNYPPQHRNVSFGPGSSNAPPTTLLGAGVPAQWFLPSDGALGSSWTAPGFDVSMWNNAVMPLSYTAGTSAGSPVLSVDFNDDDMGETGAANTEAGFSTMTLSVNPATFGSISVQLSPLGAGILDDRDRGTPTQGGLLTLDQIYDDFIFVNGQVNGDGARIQISGLATSTDYQLTIWSFDSSSLGQRVSDWIETASGATRVITNGYTFDGNVLPARDTDNTFGGVVTSSSTGTLAIEGRRSGGTSHGVFLNGMQLAPLSGSSVSGNLTAMYQTNSSVYVRVPFNVGNTGGINALTLRMKYNDGFVAYLNGTEIAFRNAPDAPDWNSAAIATHDAGTTEDIFLPAATSLLVNGTNVLALHGLNVHATNADFFLEPQLLATLVTTANNRFFSPPTPASLNNSGFVGVVADTKFSVDRGFYDAPFSLSITCATPGVSIYFTTNGSAPTPTNGFLFSSPINVAGNSFIRAQAFLAGWVPSGVDTHSHVFLRDVLSQSNNIPGYPATWQGSYPADYAMDSNIVNHPVYGATISNDLRSIPSLILVSDQNGLWNASTGIYPNATSSGTAWQRAASLELIRGDGHTEFATTAKIQMHGNASRDNVRTPKHSIGISFNSDYGPTKLNYDWFGGGVDKHDGIVLRSCGFVDGWAGRYADNSLYTSSETGESFRGLRYRPENTCYLRDAWVKDSFRDMGWLSSRSAYVHLYINGLYWGLYEPSEHLDASYFQQHAGGEQGAWDVVVGEDNNGPPVLVDGSLTDWNNVLALANAGVTTEAAYAAITNLVEIDNLIDYMLLHIVAESEDWPRHNWYMAHRRATNGVPATKFICSVWDQELTLDRLVRRDRTSVGGSGGEIYGPARVYQQLRAWPEFVRQFGDRVQKHLFNGGALTPTNNVNRLLAPAAIIRDALVGESARWGDARKTGVPAGQIGTGQTFTRDEWWQPEIDKLATNFFQHLTADNVTRLRAASLYPQLGAPSFNQFGGNVPAGFTLSMTHTNAAGTIYFTMDGSDPRVYGSGAVAPGAQAFLLAVPINAPTGVRARVRNGANWSALVEAVFYPPQDFSKLALTEIMYRPPALAPYTSGDLEFIELKNYGTNTLDLTGCGFIDGITFSFTNGTLLAPGQFFVLARNATAFAARYPGMTVNGIFSGQLANDGERVTLAQQAGAAPPSGPAIFSINYAITAPWPVTPNGFGFSLVPKDPGLAQAPDDGARWRASSAAGGSPGADDPDPLIAPIVINEVLTHTDFPQTDAIELFNLFPLTWNIGGWFLTDDPDLPMKFRIPDGTIILPQSFVTFDESQFNPTPGTKSSFSLSSSGEQVYLFSGDANTNLTGYSHGFAFGAAANGVSFGRHINSVGEEQFPAQIATTLNTNNSGPRVGPLVINEIHYHPVLPEDAFVELKNITATNVALFDPANPANTWKLEGLGFTFPTNITVPPGGLVLLVVSNIAGFAASHAVPANVLMFSYEYLGTLQKSGERLSLTRPDAPGTNGTPYIVVDSVRYNDKAPWPAAADGGGPSLQRKDSNQYGDDPINWEAASATPGRENAETDTDGDGVPDAWETAHGTNPLVPDANDDNDGDGFTNYQEYLAGTDPLDPQSRLRVEKITASSGGVQFEFTAASNRTFSVQFQDTLAAGMWSPLTNILSSPVLRIIVIDDPRTNGTRFYRLAAP